MSLFAEKDMTHFAYLAFETGGTKLVAAVADADGMLIETAIRKRKPNDRAEDSLQQLIDAARELRERHEANGKTFRGIGFGYGGQVKRAAQMPLACIHEAGWEKINVRHRLSDMFDLPVVIENDCKVAALAEAKLGAGRTHRTVFYITIGTGIGGGIVRDGAIADFGDDGEAEIGHIVVHPSEGFACGCGNKGCLEAYCSGPGMHALAKWSVKQHPQHWRDNAFAQRSLHDKSFSAKDLFEAWDKEVFAGVVIRIATSYLAFALGSMIQLINPDAIIFGGGVAAGNNRFIQQIENDTRKFVMPNLRDRCKFVSCELRERVVAQGAALLAKQLF
jgi:glucokinase